ncbi:LppX_LprAFG lipoprotein [Actinomycetospora sp. TBRC 11914]|uniref:LppX_LprAFG lipoprotein n=1 Tax=Actinomycetospora sp. TBRC 11914 TaxID=2729387 RepID=UPI00145DE3E1|nr:LppX_LprAFG lipoprotein [Actinomycetospora sp. TBRC 11914]NMO92522.1 LppX_LprAFG lipoprotein [Actinomycetospora sp. TBRC 11914]
MGPDDAGRGRLAALAALLCLAVLAGCSTGEDAGAADPATASRAVRDAAAATAAAGGASVTTASAGPARGRPASTTGTGTVDFRGGTATLALRVSRLGAVNAVLVGRTAYAALPPRAVGDLARGRQWVSVDLDRVDVGLFGDTVVQLGAGATGNPADLPALLAGLRDDAALVGPETIDGTPTTHYRGTVDLTAVATATPGLAPLVERFRAELATSALPVEVWVDDAGRLRRVVEVLRPADLPGGGATATTTLADPGPRPAATAPPAVGVRNLFAELGSGDG